MGCPPFALIGNNLTFSVTTHDPDTGVLTDADAVPAYRVYEDETGTAILTGSMAKLDDANTTGFYSEQLAVTSGNGFEDGKSYNIYITATVDSDEGGLSYSFNALSATRGAAGTALPAVAADGAGGLPVSDAGGLDMDAIGTSVAAIENDTGTSGVLIAADAITATAIQNNAITADKIATGAIDADAVAADFFDEVNAQVDTALSDIHLDHLLAADYDPSSKPGTATALLNELIENDGGVSRFTANALEQGPSGTESAVLVSTTVASINSQTSIVLTAGADFDDAYNDQSIVLYDASNNDYPSVRKVSDYTGATKTVTLDSAPDFTIAASGDGVKIFQTAPGTSAPTAAQVADAVWDEAASGHTTAGTFGEQCGTDIDAILTDTAEIGAAGAGLTAVPWNSSWDAEVQSECNDALVALGLDHLVSAAVTGTDVTDNSIFAYIVSKSATADWDDFDNTTDSLQAITDDSTTGLGYLVVAESAVDDASATTSAFDTDLTEATDGHYDFLLLHMTSGAASGQCRWIGTYTGSGGNIELTEPLEDAPADNDTFVILAYRHPEMVGGTSGI